MHKFTYVKQQTKKLKPQIRIPRPFSLFFWVFLPSNIPFKHCKWSAQGYA